METSAKTGFNAQELFIEAAKTLYNDYLKFEASGGKNNDDPKKIKDILISKPSKKEKGKCC